MYRPGTVLEMARAAFPIQLLYRSGTTVMARTGQLPTPTGKALAHESFTVGWATGPQEKDKSKHGEKKKAGQDHLLQRTFD